MVTDSDDIFTSFMFCIFFYFNFINIKWYSFHNLRLEINQYYIPTTSIVWTPFINDFGEHLWRCSQNFPG